MDLKRHLLTALAFLPAVAGCERKSEQDPAEAPAALNTPVKAVSRRPASQAELAGDWLVAAVNGNPMTREQITVKIDAGTIKAQSGCVEFEWLYTFFQGGFRTERPPDPRPVCDRGRSGWETAFGDSLAGASAVDLLGDGSLRIRGPGGVVALRRLGSPPPETVVLSAPAECVRSPASEPPIQATLVQGPAGPIRLIRSSTCAGGAHRLAPLVGRLVLRDGCLEIEERPGQPLIWPAETRVVLDPTSGEVRLASKEGAVATPGAYVEMGGAHGSAARSMAAVPAQCAGPGAFVVGSFSPCPDCATPSRPSAAPLPLPPPPPPPPPLPPPPPREAPAPRPA